MCKLHQRKYWCPHCEGAMEIEEHHTVSRGEIKTVACINEECDYEGVGWDTKKLESYEINKIQRMEELIDVDD